MHTVRTSAPGYHVLREEGRLQEDIGGLLGNRGAQAAHDAADAYRTRVIADYERIAVGRDLLAIEQRQFFALRGHPRPDRSLEQVEIVRMQGLAELEHDEIGDVHGRVYRSQPCPAQLLGHPHRRSCA